MDLFKIVTNLLNNNELSSEDSATLAKQKVVIAGKHLDAVAEAEAYRLARAEKAKTAASSKTSSGSSVYNIKPYTGNYNLRDGLQKGEFIKPTNGWVSNRNHSGYKAIDFAANEGTPIYAVADGVVTVIKHLTTSYGNHLYIDHGNGYISLYAHCHSILVTLGQEVKQGQEIATVGNTGNSRGAHLHFEIRLNGTTIDPYDYLDL